MRTALKAAWWTGTAIWILFCALVVLLAEPGAGAAVWSLGILFMAVGVPSAVYALGFGLGPMFHQS